MKYNGYKPLEIEPELLNFWKSHKIQQKIKEQNKSGEKFYFLQGPPYTSGRIHLGHVWNMALKDMFLRYKRMRGFDVWDRAGYDMHGLPTEHATEKKLKIKGSDEIKRYGIGRFVKECEALCKRNMELMSRDFLRIGSSFDFNDPYQSITREFITGEWMLIKRAHEDGRLYEGLRTLHWDTASSTGVAKHELEYKQVTDTSVYIKFQLKDKPKNFFVVWTTTPWTLPFNLALMVHPDIEYVHCLADSETWIIAKTRAEHVIKEKSGKDYRIIKKTKGKDLEGISYIHPFEGEIPFFNEIKKNKKLHTVLLSNEYVDEASGTGIVHAAPGCGPEDYEVGYANGLPAFNTVDQKGVLHSCGPFTGLLARKDDQQFIKLFDEKNSVIAKEKYTHDYPHDMRSHEPVIFRATKQWFFKVEDLKKDMIAANDAINWVPESGYNAFSSWLENLRDNSISKQRFWGTPIPVWRNIDNEEDYIVVGSAEELERLSDQRIKDLHRPWIDEVLIRKDGMVYRRVEGVLDVWVDAGTTGWNCLYYPERKDFFDSYFPADFILEGKDQIRGWFNLLMIASFLVFKKPSFKSVYMHGFLTDVEGVKMSKSLGNVISPDEAINRYGADALRFYSVQTAAGQDMNFSWEEIALKERQLHVLWNIHKYLISITDETNTDPFSLDTNLMGNLFDVPEKLIFSRLHDTIKAVTQHFESHNLDQVSKPIEDLFLDLSRTYIKLVREKSSIGSKEEKDLAAYTLAHVLLKILQIFAPVAPFITEAVYQNLKERYCLGHESIHMLEWPEYDSNYINKALEANAVIADEIISAVLNGRERIGLNVRWPLQEIAVISSSKAVKNSVKSLLEVIKRQANAREVIVLDSLERMKETIRPDKAKISPRYKELSPRIFAYIEAEHPDTILSHVNETGSYSFMLGENEIILTKDDLIVEREVPAPYYAVEFKYGIVCLNQKRTDELEGEGYSREIIRRIQELRKKEQLKKPDRIILYIKTSQELKELLLHFEEDMKQKVGADKIKIDFLDPAKKHSVSSTEEIKSEEIRIYLDKIS